MHSCPNCGQACYCGGDIDDVELEGGEEGCVCCDGDEDWDIDEDYVADEGTDA